MPGHEEQKKTKKTTQDKQKENIQSVFCGENVAGTAYARLGGVLGCFGCLGCFVLDSQKGDQGGGPKMDKTQHGVKPDIFEKAAHKWPKFWVG